MASGVPLRDPLDAVGASEDMQALGLTSLDQVVPSVAAVLRGAPEARQSQVDGGGQLGGEALGVGATLPGSDLDGGLHGALGRSRTCSLPVRTRVPIQLGLEGGWSQPVSFGSLGAFMMLVGGASSVGTVVDVVEVEVVLVVLVLVEVVVEVLVDVVDGTVVLVVVDGQLV